jgi:rod shape-determining protein MreD
MISRHQEFSLPASGTRIALSLLIALVLNWLPWSGIGLALRPDFVALVLLHWRLREPARVGIAVAWAMGILADVGDVSLLGQHALAYSVMAFAAGLLHRRMQTLHGWHLALQIFLILLLGYAIYAAVQWQVRGQVEWRYFLGCAVSALLWTPLSLLLQKFRRPRANPSTL